jgi:hypothetical protein
LAVQGADILVSVNCAEGEPKILGSHVLLAVGRKPNTDDLGLERWIDVESVSRDSVTYTSWIVVEQIGSYDLEIVVGGVCERSLAVAIPEGPNSRHIRAQLVVDGYVASIVDGYAGAPPELIRRRVFSCAMIVLPAFDVKSKSSHRGPDE